MVASVAAFCGVGYFAIQVYQSNKTSGTTTQITTDGSSGISGTVTASPTCPVSKPGDKNCLPHPLTAQFAVQSPEGSTVTSFTTNEDGVFSVFAAPGTYHIVRTYATAPPQIGGCPTTSVTVISGKHATIDIVCDTGIR